MAPVTSIRSIRLHKDLWAWIAAEAERRGLTVNGLVSDLLQAGRVRAEEPKPAKPTKAKPDIAAKHADIAARFPKTVAKLAESEQVPKVAKAKPAGRIRGFTDDGEPIFEPPVVSRQKAGKK